MNIPYSKKELYKDNQKLNKELNNVLSVNIELKILYDCAMEEIEKVNEKIKVLNEIKGILT